MDLIADVTLYQGKPPNTERIAPGEPFSCDEDEGADYVARKFAHPAPAAASSAEDSKPAAPAAKKKTAAKKKAGTKSGG